MMLCRLLLSRVCVVVTNDDLSESTSSYFCVTIRVRSTSSLVVDLSGQMAFQSREVAIEAARDLGSPFLLIVMKTYVFTYPGECCLIGVRGLRMCAATRDSIPRSIDSFVCPSTGKIHHDILDVILCVP